MKCTSFRLWRNRLDGILLIARQRLQGVTRPPGSTHPVRLDAQLVESLLSRGKEAREERQQMLVNLTREFQICAFPTSPTTARVSEPLGEESMRQRRRVPSGQTSRQVRGDTSSYFEQMRWFKRTVGWRLFIRRADGKRKRNILIERFLRQR